MKTKKERLFARIIAAILAFTFVVSSFTPMTVFAGETDDIQALGTGLTQTGGDTESELLGIDSTEEAIDMSMEGGAQTNESSDNQDALAPEDNGGSYIPDETKNPDEGNVNDNPVIDDDDDDTYDDDYYDGDDDDKDITGDDDEDVNDDDEDKDIDENINEDDINDNDDEDVNDDDEDDDKNLGDEDADNGDDDDLISGPVLPGLPELPVLPGLPGLPGFPGTGGGSSIGNLFILNADGEELGAVIEGETGEVLSTRFTIAGVQGMLSIQADLPEGFTSDIFAQDMFGNIITAAMLEAEADQDTIRIGVEHVVEITGTALSAMYEIVPITFADTTDEGVIAESISEIVFLVEGEDIVEDEEDEEKELEVFFTIPGTLNLSVADFVPGFDINQTLLAGVTAVDQDGNDVTEFISVYEDSGFSEWVVGTWGDVINSRVNIQPVTLDTFAQPFTTGLAADWTAELPVSEEVQRATRLVETFGLAADAGEIGRDPDWSGSYDVYEEFIPENFMFMPTPGGEIELAFEGQVLYAVTLTDEDGEEAEFISEPRGLEVAFLGVMPTNVNINVNSHTGLVNAIAQATAANPVTVVLTGSFTQTAQIVIPANATVTIISDGNATTRTITSSITTNNGSGAVGSRVGRHFRVNAGSTLNLGTTAGGVTGANNFNLNVANADSTSHGGGVFVAGGTLNMRGGRINGSRGHHGGAIETGAAGSIVNISGGEIVNSNSTCTVTNHGGGALWVEGGIVTITGGDIRANRSNGDGTGIFVHSGTFNMTGGQLRNHTPRSTNIRGIGIHNQNGNVTIGGNAQITGNTTFSGASSQGGGVFLTGSGTLTVEGTASISNNSSHGLGGGISHTSSGLVTIRGNATIANNTATTGAGINHSGSGGINMSGGTIRANTASGAGGGINITGNGPVNITGGIIGGNAVADGNRANNGTGGGVNITGTGAITINNSAGNTTISRNVAAGTGNNGAGGGVNIGGTGTSAITINGGNITHNTSSTNGGGINVTGNRPVNLQGGTLGNNISSANGGGISVGGSGGVTISGGVIENNQANNGGGVSHSAGNLTITNGTIRNNIATNQGGGYHFNSTGTATINSITLTGNQATNQGGGFWLGANGQFNMVRATVTNNRVGLDSNGQVLRPGVGDSNDTATNANGGGIFSNQVALNNINIGMVGGTNTAADIIFEGNRSAAFGGAPLTLVQGTQWGLTNRPNIRWRGQTTGTPQPLPSNSVDVVPVHLINNWDVNSSTDVQVTVMPTITRVHSPALGSSETVHNSWMTGTDPIINQTIGANRNQIFGFSNSTITAEPGYRPGHRFVNWTVTPATTLNTVTGQPRQTSFVMPVGSPPANRTLTANWAANVAPTITGNPTNGTTGSAYTFAPTAGSASPSVVVWSVVSGSLPDGLTLNTTTGAITGTPTVAGTFTFTLRAQNSATEGNGPIGDQPWEGSHERPITILIQAGVLITNNPDWPQASANGQTTSGLPQNQGAQVTVNAGTRQHHTFDGWTTTTPGVTLINAAAQSGTTFTMPSTEVNLVANWTPHTAPVITGDTPLSVIQGEPLSEGYTATSYPVPTWLAATIPAAHTGWLTFNTTTGVLSGTPGFDIAPGTFTVTLRAQNSFATTTYDVQVTVGIAQRILTYDTSVNGVAIQAVVNGTPVSSGSLVNVTDQVFFEVQPIPGGFGTGNSSRFSVSDFPVFEVQSVSGGLGTLSNHQRIVSDGWTGITSFPMPANDVNATGFVFTWQHRISVATTTNGHLTVAADGMVDQNGNALNGAQLASAVVWAPRGATATFAAIPANTSWITGTNWDITQQAAGIALNGSDADSRTAVIEPNAAITAPITASVGFVQNAPVGAMLTWTDGEGVITAQTRFPAGSGAWTTHTTPPATPLTIGTEVQFLAAPNATWGGGDFTQYTVTNVSGHANPALNAAAGQWTNSDIARVVTNIVISDATGVHADFTFAHRHHVRFEHIQAQNAQTHGGLSFSAPGDAMVASDPLNRFIPRGTAATFTTTPNTPVWETAAWQGAAVAGNIDQATATFTPNAALTAPVVVRAEFRRSDIPVDFDEDQVEAEIGSVPSDVDPDDYKPGDPVLPGTTVPAGTNILFRVSPQYASVGTGNAGADNAAADTQFQITGRTATGGTWLNNNDLNVWTPAPTLTTTREAGTLVNVTSPVNASFTLAHQHYVTFTNTTHTTPAGNQTFGGTISMKDIAGLSAWVNHGTPVTFEATPASGWIMGNWSANLPGTATATRTAAITAPLHGEVNFRQREGDIRLDLTMNGTGTIIVRETSLLNNAVRNQTYTSSDKVWLNGFSRVEFFFVPDHHGTGTRSHVNSLTFTGVGNGEQSLQPLDLTIEQTQDGPYAATFNISYQHQITTSVTGTNGSLNITSANVEAGGWANHGASVQFTAAPSPGYEVNTFTVNGSSVNNITHGGNNHVENVTITVPTGVVTSFNMIGDGPGDRQFGLVVSNYRTANAADAGAVSPIQPYVWSGTTTPIRANGNSSTPSTLWNVDTNDWFNGWTAGANMATSDIVDQNQPNTQVMMPNLTLVSGNTATVVANWINAYTIAANISTAHAYGTLDVTTTTGSALGTTGHQLSGGTNINQSWFVPVTGTYTATVVHNTPGRLVPAGYAPIWTVNGTQLPQTDARLSNRGWTLSLASFSADVNIVVTFVEDPTRPPVGNYHADISFGMVSPGAQSTLAANGVTADFANQTRTTTADFGDTVVFTATPGYGYRVVSWSVERGGTVVHTQTGGTTLTQAIDALWLNTTGPNVTTVTVTFAPETPAVLVVNETERLVGTGGTTGMTTVWNTEPEHSSTSVSGDYNFGQNVTVAQPFPTTAAGAQYELTGITITTSAGTVATGNATDLAARSITFTINENREHVVEFEWTLVRNTVNLQHQIVGGAVATAYDITIPNVPYGATVPFAINSAIDEFNFTSALYGHEQASGAAAWSGLNTSAVVSGTLTNVIEDLNITANFVPMTFQLQFSVNGAQVANASDFANTTFTFGDSLAGIPALTPAPGFIFTGWDMQVLRTSNIHAGTQAYLDTIETNASAAVAGVSVPFAMGMPSTGLRFTANLEQTQLIVTPGPGTPEQEIGDGNGLMSLGTGRQDAYVPANHSRSIIIENDLGVTLPSMQLVLVNNASAGSVNPGAADPRFVLDQLTIPSMDDGDIVTVNIEPVLGLIALNETAAGQHRVQLQIWDGYGTPSGRMVGRINVIFTVTPPAYNIGGGNQDENSSVLPAVVITPRPHPGDEFEATPIPTPPTAPTAPGTIPGFAFNPTDIYESFEGRQVTVSAGGPTNGQRVIGWRFFDESGNPVPASAQLEVWSGSGALTAANSLGYAGAPKAWSDGIVLTDPSITPGFVRLAAPANSAVATTVSFIMPGNSITAVAVWVSDSGSSILPINFPMTVNHVGAGTTITPAPIDRIWGTWVSVQPAFPGSALASFDSDASRGWQAVDGIAQGQLVWSPNQTAPNGLTLPLGFMMPAEAVELDAHWLPMTRVHVIGNGASIAQAGENQNNGASDANGPTAYVDATAGTTVSIFASTRMPEGYDFDRWTFYDAHPDTSGANVVDPTIANTTSAISSRTSIQAQSFDVWAVANWVETDGTTPAGNISFVIEVRDASDNIIPASTLMVTPTITVNAVIGMPGRFNISRAAAANIIEASATGFLTNGYLVTGNEIATDVITIVLNVEGTPPPTNPGGGGDGGTTPPGGGGDGTTTPPTTEPEGPGSGPTAPGTGGDNDNSGDTGDSDGSDSSDTGNPVLPPVDTGINPDLIFEPDTTVAPYNGNGNIPGPFFGAGNQTGNPNDGDNNQVDIADPFGAPGSPANAPGIVWQDISNPQTGDEQNFTGLIASSVALIISSAALFVIVVVRRRKEREEEEIEAYSNTTSNK